MSLIHMKKFLTALLLLLVIAQCSTASAQLSQGRLWSPVASDQFGGGARLRSGFWGEIDYNYWLITQGDKTEIGYTGGSLGTSYYLHSGTHYRKNTMGTDMVEQDFHNGTTIRIGNQVGHHGWELKTTIMSSQTSMFEGYGGEMDINDQLIRTIGPFSLVGGEDDYSYYYSPIGGSGVLPTPMLNGQTYNVGALWGWVTTPGDSEGYDFAMTPLPIFFDEYKITTKISHWDVEANYIFRMHPTRIGFFEFTGGVRYMQLDDQLNFFSTGRPYDGLTKVTVTTNNNNNNNNSDSSSDSSNNNNTGTGEEYSYYTGTASGVGNILTDCDWAFSAKNHIVGPQVGARYIRKVGRWSLILDTKFFAGFNAQRLTSRGTFASDALTRGSGSTSSGDNGGSGSGSSGSSSTSTGNSYDYAVERIMENYPWTPLGYQYNMGSFNHSENRTEFTPGLDLRLMANWQMTDAIGITAGYQGMYLDKTARSSKVNDYTLHHTGQVFGISENVNDQTWMHGFTLGITMNRY